MRSTRPFIPRILLAFDFDGTLVSDSIDAMRELYRLSRADCDRDFVEALGDGWDAIMRRGPALIDLGQARHAADRLMRDGAEWVRLFENAVRACASRMSRCAREQGE